MCERVQLNWKGNFIDSPLNTHEYNLQNVFKDPPHPPKKEMEQD